MHVLVVGGGITGLAASHALAKAGVPTTLVEASGRLGGKIQTDRIDGFVVESGPDSFVNYRPGGVQLARELGLEADLVAPCEPREVHIRTGRRFVPLPQEMGLVLPTSFRPFVTTRLFSPLEKLRMGLDLALPRSDLSHDVGVGEHLRRRLGRALVDRLAGPLLGGVYGTSIDELSLLAVLPQLRDAEQRHRSLFLASLAAGRARRGGSRSPFVALRRGTGQLVGALVAELGRASDVEIRTGMAVTALEPHGHRLQVRLASGELLRPDVTVLATPSLAAADLLADGVPAAAVALRSIPHGTTTVVSLAYRDDQFATPPVGHGFLVAPDERLSIDACTISSHKWPDRAPDGTVLIRAFIGSRSGRSIGMSDEAVIGAAVGDVATTLGAHGDPILVRLARWTGQMPQYTVGHLDRVGAAFAALGDFPTVILAGASYRGVGIPDCIAQGQAGAARAQGLLAAEGTVEVPAEHVPAEPI